MALQADEDTIALQTEVEVIQSDSVLFQAAQSIDLIRLVRQNEGKDAAQGSAPITSQERGAMVGIMKQRVVHHDRPQYADSRDSLPRERTRSWPRTSSTGWWIPIPTRV